MIRHSFLYDRLALLGGLATASVIDAPHNETNAISCGSCHSYSLWWQYSPISAQTDYKQKVSALCLGCHDGTNPSRTVMRAHSSATMNPANDPQYPLGVWSTDCADCHDPHRQDQLEWRTANPTDLYLVSGGIASVSPDLI